MKCEKCGNENADNNKVCQKCGAPIELKSLHQNEQTPNSQLPINPQQIQNQKKAWYKQWWIWLITGLGSFTLFLCAISFGILLLVVSNVETKQPNPTSSLEGTTEAVTEAVSDYEITYSPDTLTEFKDIEYKYDGLWIEDTEDSKIVYTNYYPLVQLSVISTEYSNPLYIPYLLDEYKEAPEDATLIDEESLTLDDKYLVKRFVQSYSSGDGSKNYMETIAFGYNYNIYAFVVIGEYEYKDYCHNAISETFDTLQLKEIIPITEEPTTEKPKTEPPVEKHETVIFNNLGIKIICTGVEESWNGKNVKLRIENNSGYDYTFQVRDVSVNGYMISPPFSCGVKNGKIANDELSFRADDLEENNISEIDEIELSVHAFNWDDDSHDFDSEMITFNP